MTVLELKWRSNSSLMDTNAVSIRIVVILERESEYLLTHRHDLAGEDFHSRQIFQNLFPCQMVIRPMIRAHVPNTELVIISPNRKEGVNEGEDESMEMEVSLSTPLGLLTRYGTIMLARLSQKRLRR